MSRVWKAKLVLGPAAPAAHAPSTTIGTAAANTANAPNRTSVSLQHPYAVPPCSVTSKAVEVTRLETSPRRLDPLRVRRNAHNNTSSVDPGRFRTGDLCRGVRTSKSSRSSDSTDSRPLTSAIIETEGDRTPPSPLAESSGSHEIEIKCDPNAGMTQHLAHDLGATSGAGHRGFLVAGGVFAGCDDFDGSRRWRERRNRAPAGPARPMPSGAHGFTPDARGRGNAGVLATVATIDSDRSRAQCDLGQKRRGISRGSWAESR